jgi:TolB-like protein
MKKYFHQINVLQNKNEVFQRHSLTYKRLKMKKKNLKRTLFTLMILSLWTPVIFSQAKASLAVINIKSVKMPYESQQLTDVTRNAMEKLNQYYVIDKYDQVDMAERADLKLDDCSSRKCLVESGKELQADYVLTGSVESFGDKIIVKFRVVNVMTTDIEHFKILEFLDLKDQIQTMIELTLKEMYSLDLDNDLLTKLTKANAFENTINTPEVQALDLSGPRMGLTIMTGQAAELFTKPKNEGGYDILPVITQFGYQFEIKYLNEGNFQALFEIVPIISGLDQGLFIPSITLLNGLRSNKSGWEVGFGPQLIINRQAKGYFDESGIFVPVSGGSFPQDKSEVVRADSRGSITAGTGFVFAFGKTFKSGSLNMPVNVFYKPAKNAHQFGISLGFNTGGMRNRKK